MKKILLIISLLILNVSGVWAAAPLQPLNPEIFQLVQTTPRAQYYFNKSVITFATNNEGYIDPNTLIVPTVKILDNTEVQDIIMKRQWREESVYRFNELAATAEYLKIDLNTSKIEFSNNDYLDRGYNPFRVGYSKPEVDLNNMSELNVNYNFYKTIIDYGKTHRREILKNMLKDGKKMTEAQLSEYHLLPNGDDQPVATKKHDKHKRVKR